MLALLVAAAINLYAGDASERAGYVHGTSEDARIQGHLLFVHDLLAAADVSTLSPELRTARARNLERLERYARARQFPRNDDHPDARRPTFVDSQGQICAVGALFASDRGYPAAVRVAERFKYAYIVQIDDADLAEWQRSSGLTTQELALIQPSYGWREPEERSSPLSLWRPWGLTDRQQFGRSRVAISQEVSTTDSFATTTTTFYGHAPYPDALTTSLYIAMPISFVVDAEHMDDIAAAGGRPAGGMGAGGTQMRDPSRFAYGNGDVGIFFGNEDRDEGTATLHRIGVLLPTATESIGAHSGMRAGDFVTELPRSLGARLSTSRMVGWKSHGTGYAVRFDAGADYAHGEEQSYVVPRAALGMLFAKRFATISFDTSVAHVFDEHADGSLRWSGGTTIRVPFPCGFQPALTFAAVRTPEGWGGAFAFELAMAFRARDPAR